MKFYALLIVTAFIIPAFAKSEKSQTNGSAMDFPENHGKSNNLNYVAEKMTIKSEVVLKKDVISEKEKDKSPFVKKDKNGGATPREKETIKRYDARGDIYFLDGNKKETDSCDLIYATNTVETSKSSDNKKTEKILSPGLQIESQDAGHEIYEVSRNLEVAYSRKFNVSRDGKSLGSLIVDCNFNKVSDGKDLRARYKKALEKIGFNHEGIPGPEKIAFDKEKANKDKGSGGSR